MAQSNITDLDPIIHAPVRLAILSVLITAENADFNYLKNVTATSDGNLSTHLNKLEATGMITIEKKFVGKKPQTLCKISEKGRQEFRKYLEQMEKFIAGQKISE